MHYKRIKLITDACCIIPKANVTGRAGFGKCACGVLIVDENDMEIAKTGVYLGEMTVPESEYNGIICGLEKASEFTRNHVEVWSDSQLVINHLNKTWKLAAENLKPLYDKIKMLEARFVKVDYFHHQRENPLAKIADAIANGYYKKVNPK